MKYKAVTTLTAIAVLALASSTAIASNSKGCSALPSHSALKSALIGAVEAERSGLDFQMWATLVSRNGKVCAVAFSGGDSGAQWPGSRVISAQKANTGNAFNLDGLALSTANLFSAVQPGGSLFGLQESNPVDTNVAYRGPSSKYGRRNDPMVGKRIGGVNVFGGGFGLYTAGRVVGGLGVSGDTSCADHMIGWRVRNALHLDEFGATVGGVNPVDPMRPDNIIYDITEDETGGAGVSTSGFGHPQCINTGDEALLPEVN